jgi:hypothetical protein
MFVKANSIVINNSASIIPNNLSIIIDSKKLTRYAIISKNLVILVYININKLNQ